MAKHMLSKQLRDNVLLFLQNRKYANNIVDILSLLSNDEKCAQASILALELAFSELLKRGDMQDGSKIYPEESDPESFYRRWLNERYEETFNKLLDIIETGKPTVQMQALSSFVKVYLSLEGKYLVDATAKTDYYFPINRLKALMLKVLSSDKSNSNVISRLQEYASYQDFLFFSWKLLPTIVIQECKPNEIYAKNLIDLLDKIALPKKEAMEKNLLLYGKEEANNFVPKLNLLHKWLNKVWNCMSKWHYWEYSHATQQQLLVVLLEKLLPHLDRPLLLTDYFVDSLDVGGPVSLLALQGIFILMQNHNLEYPNIFKKLYSLFEPEIFHTKHKARLFYLSDIFLSSTHLPENLVAAFAKRLSRLALVAPPQDILIILRFIGNLLIRHPGLSCLVNYHNSREVSSDPYIMEESDPVKSGAIESSLWELQSLQTHNIPYVATAAKFINLPLPSIEWDLSQVLESTADDIFDKELKKRVKELTLTFEKPSSISLPNMEKLIQYWSIS